MARKQADPAAQEAKIRAHAAKLGLDPAAIASLVALLLKLVKIMPAIIDLFLATKTKKDAGKFLASSPEAVAAERQAIERDFARAIHGHGDETEVTGLMGGPATEALLAKAMKSLMDFLGRHTDEAAALIDSLLNKVVTTP